MFVLYYTCIIRASFSEIALCITTITFIIEEALQLTNEIKDKVAPISISLVASKSGNMLFINILILDSFIVAIFIVRIAPLVKKKLKKTV